MLIGWRAVIEVIAHIFADKQDADLDENLGRPVKPRQ
jgi:hypothetical protein